MYVCREVWDCAGGGGWGESESRQNGRKDAGDGLGKINRQLNGKVAKMEGEVRARLLETEEKLLPLRGQSHRCGITRIM